MKKIPPGDMLHQGGTLAGDSEMVVDANTLDSLITYAACEIDSRRSGLKDAGTLGRQELISEIEEGNAVLDKAREAVQIQSRHKTDALRGGFGLMRTGFVECTVALNEPVLCGDAELMKRLESVEAALLAVKGHMDVYYEWE